jgi:hypothetical protein
MLLWHVVWQWLKSDIAFVASDTHVLENTSCPRRMKIPTKLLLFCRRPLFHEGFTFATKGKWIWLSFVALWGPTEITQWCKKCRIGK